MRATITRSWSVTALVYKPLILGLKNEEFLFLVDLRGLQSISKRVQTPCMVSIQERFLIKSGL